ncbi:MAG: hypothetical protein ACHQQ3_10880, partial [Gemmatimonadales bacterium]
QADLAAIFAERSLGLTRPGGALALLLPSKLWRSLAGGGIRRVIADDAVVVAVEDWAESRSAFDAVVYPSLLVARRRSRGAHRSAEGGRRETVPEPPLRIAVHRREELLSWTVERSGLALESSPGAPWLLLPPDARTGFDRLVRTGPPLSQSLFGRPLLGVKSGCNDAFVLTPRPGWREAPPGEWPVRDRAPDASLDGERGGPREGCVETSLLRPLLRGEHVRSWRVEPDDGALLWTHGADGAPLPRLPRGAAGWLAPWRRRLEIRSDVHASPRWWSLFRTESARCDVARVVWSDIGKSPRALVLPVGDPTVPLNSCYVARAPSFDDALAFAALLNSPVAAAWLNAIAEPARGSYHRYLGWTLARLPLPADWPRAVSILAPLARVALEGEPPSPAELADATVRAYRVRASDLSALMTWCLR